MTKMLSRFWSTPVYVQFVMCRLLRNSIAFRHSAAGPGGCGSFLRPASALSGGALTPQCCTCVSPLRKAKPRLSKPIRSWISLLSPSGQPEGGVSLPSANFRISSASSIASCRVRMISTPMTTVAIPAVAQLLFGAPPSYREQISTLLIAADRRLQAVPFAALSDGQAFFGERCLLTHAVSGLNGSGCSNPTGRRLLALGASEFEGLAALPMVPQNPVRSVCPLARILSSIKSSPHTAARFGG